MLQVFHLLKQGNKEVTGASSNPDDIIVKDKKIAGFIIENKRSNSVIHTSVLGIGLNINQSLFQAYVPEATSIRLSFC